MILVESMKCLEKVLNNPLEIKVLIPASGNSCCAAPLITLHQFHVAIVIILCNNNDRRVF